MPVEMIGGGLLLAGTQLFSSLANAAVHYETRSTLASTQRELIHKQLALPVPLRTFPCSLR